MIYIYSNPSDMFLRFVLLNGAPYSLLELWQASEALKWSTGALAERTERFIIFIKAVIQRKGVRH